MPKRYLGNIITDTPTPPADGFSDTSASGVWSLAEANAYTAAGLWPSQANGAAEYAYMLGFQESNRERTLIASTGTSTNFGTMSDTSNTYQGATSSNTRGIVGGSSVSTNDFLYWTLATDGTTQVFGDAVVSGSARLTGNNTRAISARMSSADNSIEYLTIASTGNGTDFGDLTVGRGVMGGASSTTRSLFLGGWPSGSVFDTVDYITIGTTGNATDFGDLTGPRAFNGGLADGTRAVCSAGNSNTSPTTYVNTMDYVTMASTGNFSDFGDATQTSRGWAGAAGSTKGLFMGSDAGSGSWDTNRIDSITIQSTGNATDYGDLVKTSGRRFGACSNATVAVQPS